MPARKSPRIHTNADRCGLDTGETGSFISEVSLRTKPALLLLAGLMLGFVSGLWYAGQPSREQSPAPEQPDTNPFEQQAEQLRIQIRKKDQHLQKVGDELAALRKELATPVTLPDPSFWEGSVRPPIATNMGQARALFDTALEEQDFETIWRIGFDMLALGESAYPIVNELFEKFADEFYGGKLSSPLWRLPELYQGALLRECAEHESGLLDYMGYLSNTSSEDLPELLADFRTDLLEGPMTPMLLGFNEGRDPEKLEELLGYYEHRIDESSAGTFTNRDIIFALSHIPGDRCAVLLDSLFPDASSARQLDIVRGLVSNGSPTAIEALRDLEGEVNNQTLKRAIGDGLELLDR